MTNKFPNVSIREVSTLLDIPRDAIVNAISHGNIQPAGKGPRGHDVYPLIEILQPLFRRRGELDPAMLSPADRKNLADALLKEHDLHVKSSKYLPRQAVREGCAVAYAMVAQSVRSIPDLVERKTGATIDTCDLIEKVIDSVCSDLAERMEALHRENAESPA